MPILLRLGTEVSPNQIKCATNQGTCIDRLPSAASLYLFANLTMHASYLITLTMMQKCKGDIDNNSCAFK